MSNEKGKCLLGVYKYKRCVIGVLVCNDGKCEVNIYIPEKDNNINWSFRAFENACTAFAGQLLSTTPSGSIDIVDAPMKKGFKGIIFVSSVPFTVKVLLKASHAFVDEMTKPIQQNPKVDEFKERLTKLLDKHDVMNHAIENRINRLKCETEFDTHLWPSNGYSEETIGIKITGDLVNPYKKKKKRKK